MHVALPEAAHVIDVTSAPVTDEPQDADDANVICVERSADEVAPALTLASSSAAAAELDSSSGVVMNDQNDMV